MTEQSALVTLLLERLDTDRLWMSADTCRWTAAARAVFLRTWMPKYPRLHISMNDVSAQKLNGISRKYHHRIVKLNEI